MAEPGRGEPPIGDRLGVRGATAVEFAMLAGPFVLMLFAIIQLGLHFMVQVTLDNAAATAARQLRTGAVVADGAIDTAGASSFAKSICSNMSWLQGQCANNSTLVVDVRPLGGGYGSSAGSPVIASNGSATGACYSSGGPGSAVELRAYYRWRAPMPVMVNSSGVQQIQATEVFQVEPTGRPTGSVSPC